MNKQKNDKTSTGSRNKDGSANSKRAGKEGATGEQVDTYGDYAQKAP